jgi:hypothetical protein
VATVTTTTQTAAISAPTVPGVVRDQTTGWSVSGYLYVLVQTAAGTYTVYRSTNNGASWTSYASFARSGIQETSSLFIDGSGYAHLAYRVGTSGAGGVDSLWYRRLSLWTATWSVELQISASDANGGTIGTRWVGGIDLAVAHQANAPTNIAVFANYSDGSARYGLYGHGVSIPAGATIDVAPVNADTLFTGARTWLVSGTAPGWGMCNVEVEHNGNGSLTGTPNLWVSYGRTSLRMIKLAWQGSGVGWYGSSGTQLVRAGLSAHPSGIGRWDGVRWIMGVINPDDATTVRLYERNQANTFTSSYDTPAHPNGVVRQLAFSYDNVTKDPRIFSVGTTNDTLYYIDYSRSGTTWSAWAQFSATAPINSGGEFTVKRGGSAGNARIDVVTVTGAASPYTVTHTGQSTSSVPNIANWNTSGQPYTNGGAADTAAALTLDWDFTDPDPGDAQGAYALSRQIGTGTVNYWNAGTSTWQTTEVYNSTATTAVTLAAGWGAGTDAAHTYKVRVRDTSAVTAPGYSAALTIIPSVKVNPTLSSPTAGGTVATDRVTVTWSVTEQTQRRIRLTDSGGAVVFDSGFQVDAATSYTPDFTLDNLGSYTVELTTKNLEGLPSTPQTRTFTVNYTPPPTATSSFAPSTTGGYIAVTSAANSPAGAQPAPVSQDLYRRPAVTPVLNPNSSFTTTVTGWVVGGGGAGTLSWSAAVSAPPNAPDIGLARYVPGGTLVAAPQVENSTFVTITPGTSYTASAWIRPDTANKPVLVALNWYNASNVLLSSSTRSWATPIAGVWHYLEVTVDPATVAGAAKVRVAAGESGTPAATDAFYTDQVQIEVSNRDPGVRIAQGVSSPATVNDWGAVALTAYEYRWVTAAGNGTTSTGPWMA